ncbi:response regulator [Methylomarinum sp. Ch1-1]|uniref:Response regulator n=1 Tax=Methylomarinum roseum TaxID=3067653 RepID=A0AAU7NUV2_9GAMM|nr:response regulator [Methylomarinum sp. Ch1-1]MDP4519544.1 response regulator [Methylomarinum sp. Ch1-1]
MPPEKSARILLVDDETNVLRALTRILKRYELETFTSGEEALLIAREQPFDLVISDFRMPGMDGVQFLSRFMQFQPETIRIILTGYADLDSAQSAINEAEVFRFINKPWSHTDIVNAVQQGLEHKRILEENKRLADLVRDQQKLLAKKDALLQALEAEEPGITQVNWDENGAIVLDEDDLKDFE